MHLDFYIPHINPDRMQRNSGFCTLFCRRQHEPDLQKLRQLIYTLEWPYTMNDMHLAIIPEPLSE